MREKFKQFIFAERIALISLAVGIITWLFYSDIVPNGILSLKNDFKKRSPMISGLYPDVRVEAIEKDEEGDYFQKMTIDPVYFDVEMPRMFRTARVIVKYQNPENQPLFQIGLKNNKAEWNFLFYPIEDAANNKFNYVKEGSWRVGEATFPLNASLVDNRVLHFVFSAPRLDVSGREILIGEIKVVLAKEPVTWQNFFPRLKRKLNF